MKPFPGEAPSFQVPHSPAGDERAFSCGSADLFEGHDSIMLAGAV
jgi:hypothetical protein